MIRRLTTEDIPTVTAMVRNSFSRTLWPYMTYTQSGAGEFLDVAVRHPRSVEPRHLVVAVDERTGELAGFADFKVVADTTGFLSYVCVVPAERGRGHATAMFQDFLETYPSLDSVKLDTFRENTTARSLYERWGFTLESTSAWVTRPLPAPTEPPKVSGLPIALAAHETYGFCELMLDSPRPGGKVGVLGRTVLRCFSRATFEDDELLASVRGLMPRTTTAFAVVPESVEQEVELPHELLLLSDRMSLDLDPNRSRS